MTTQKITGKITHQTTEGGFWGIISDDGQRYRPVEGIPQVFQKVGLQVQAEIEPYAGFSVFMWGENVHLRSISAGNA
ncbi:MAG: hypothetical protein AAGN35_09895 [Bacteroidota bacterium]